MNTVSDSIVLPSGALGAVVASTDLTLILRCIAVHGDIAKGCAAASDLIGRQLSVEGLYWTILKREPRSSDPDVSGLPQEQVISRLLESEEFFQNLHNILMREWPALPRAIVVHIPKCGGSALFQGMAQSGNFTVSRPGRHVETHIPQVRREALVRVTELAFGGGVEVPNKPFAFVEHVRLRRLVRVHLRKGDEVLASVRQPVDLCISWLNFLLTSLEVYCGNEGGEGVADVRQALGVGANFSPTSCRDLVWTIRPLMEKIVGYNVLCDFLGMTPTADSALATIESQRVGLLLNTRLGEFCRMQGWTESRENESRTFFSYENIPRAELLAITDYLKEDLIFYSLLERRLRNAGDPVVRFR